MGTSTFKKTTISEHSFLMYLKSHYGSPWGYCCSYQQENGVAYPLKLEHNASFWMYVTLDNYIEVAVLLETVLDLMNLFYDEFYDIFLCWLNHNTEVLLIALKKFRSSVIGFSEKHCWHHDFHWWWK